MKAFAISFDFIEGVMLGVEIQRDPEDGHRVLVVDLLILRAMLEFVTVEE